MMAGRGEFYRNLSDGLQKTTVLEPPLGRGKRGSSRNMTRKNKASQRSSRNRTRCNSSMVSKPAPTQDIQKPPKMIHKRPQTKNNLFERLPSEILIKILSYLDATSLYFLSYVNKLFSHLANDDMLWCQIYISEFGVNQPWINNPRPRVTQCRSLPGVWKQKYFKALAGYELNKWRYELRDINPYTGLPRQTEHVLRNLNVCWKLRAKDRSGKEVMLEPSKVYFFETSVILRWGSESLTFFYQIRNLELHGLRKEMHIAKRPLWRSLMLRLDIRDCPQTICKDRLIKVVFLSQGFIVGIWRGQNVIAFIMVCLHFHMLLERSLFGSPVCPYVEPTVKFPRDRSDSKCGLHGYSLHFVLHNTGADIMSEHFPDLSSRPVTKQLLALHVIYKNNLSSHRSLSGNITLPWKTEELEGSVENCCFMTLTLLDEFQKPFWCVCAPITITRSRRSLSFDYNGEHFLMDYHHPEGQVKMKLVLLQEEKQFFLIDLTVFVPIDKVNRYFCTNY